MSDQPYLLYGAYASYYTAKVRCYLRKKGIPFAERLPSDPTFREVVRPTSGNHRIPQILAPDGEVIQDSVAIVDALEMCFPTYPLTRARRVKSSLSISWNSLAARDWSRSPGNIVGSSRKTSLSSLEILDEPSNRKAMTKR